jgi:hypothetical protein
MPKRFGQNNPYWTLDSIIGNLEAILSDEEEIQENKPSKKREKNIERSVR